MKRLNKKHLYTLIAVVSVVLMILGALWATRNVKETVNTGIDSDLVTNTTENAVPTIGPTVVENETQDATLNTAQNTTTEDDMNLNALIPKTLTGTVDKTLEKFQLTTNDGYIYHVYDPEGLIDNVVREQGAYPDNGFYNIDNIEIRGLISDTGDYGHMGSYERQVTVVEAK